MRFICESDLILPNIGFKKDLSDRLVFHYNRDKDEDDDRSGISDISKDSEDRDPLIGMKFRKMFIDGDGVSVPFMGEVMNRVKVKGEWLYRVVYNDGDSEELWVNEILEYVNGVESHGDDGINSESTSDSDYKD